MCGAPQRRTCLLSAISSPDRPLLGDLEWWQVGLSIEGDASAEGVDRSDGRGGPRWSTDCAVRKNIILDDVEKEAPVHRETASRQTITTGGTRDCDRQPLERVCPKCARLKRTWDHSRPLKRTVLEATPDCRVRISAHFHGFESRTENPQRIPAHS